MYGPVTNVSHPTQCQSPLLSSPWSAVALSEVQNSRKGMQLSRQSIYSLDRAYDSASCESMSIDEHIARCRAQDIYIAMSDSSTSHCATTITVGHSVIVHIKTFNTTKETQSYTQCGFLAVLKVVMWTMTLWPAVMVVSSSSSTFTGVSVMHREYRLQWQQQQLQDFTRVAMPYGGMVAACSYLICCNPRLWCVAVGCLSTLGFHTMHLHNSVRLLCHMLALHTSYKIVVGVGAYRMWLVW